MTLTVRKTPSLWTWLDSYYRPSSLLEEYTPWTYDWYYGTHRHPWLDMYEYKDDLWVKVDLPGLKKEDIKIGIEAGYLTIWAEKKEDKVPKDVTYYSHYRWYGTYSQSVWLPWPVDADKISATYEDGLLTIKLPKAEEAKTKTIEVKIK